jgi:phospholipase C
MLQFLERRFGVPEPNIGAWRRGAVGDLTSTLGGLGRPNRKLPRLPDAAALERAAVAQCRDLPPPSVPAVQRMPVQEPGTRPRVGAARAAGR